MHERVCATLGGSKFKDVAVGRQVGREIAGKTRSRTEQIRKTTRRVLEILCSNWDPGGLLSLGSEKDEVYEALVRLAPSSGSGQMISKQDVVEERLLGMHVVGELNAMRYKRCKQYKQTYKTF